MNETNKNELRYDQEGKDRLAKALLEALPKLVLDRITSNPTDIGYSFNIHYHYE